jgi:copper chaperone CopZ
MRTPKLFQSILSKRDTTTARFTVQGMSCAGCAERALKSVRTLPGIASADFDYAAGRATVTYDPSTASVADIQKRIVAAGFTAAALP